MTNAEKTSTVTVRYFAWVREKTGTSAETLEIPAGIETVRDLAEWMQTRDEGFGTAFQRPDAIRAALDRKHVSPDTRIGKAREIAFFPPVTGG
jgi:molybdopterin synthase sulfur carrier subunit